MGEEKATGYREPAVVTPIGPDTRPVGPLDDCPACGENGGTFTVRKVEGDAREYRGPRAAGICKSLDTCPDGAALHLHQSCATCGHPWSVLPVGPKPPKPTIEPIRQAPSFAPTIAVAATTTLAVLSLVRALMGWP